LPAHRGGGPDGVRPAERVIRCGADTAERRASRSSAGVPFSALTCRFDENVLVTPVLTGGGHGTVGSAGSTTGRPAGHPPRSRRTPLGQRAGYRQAVPRHREPGPVPAA